MLKPTCLNFRIKQYTFTIFTVIFSHSMEALEQFVNDLLDNKLEAYMKSEPVPDNSDKDVKVGICNTKLNGHYQDGM